VNQEWDKRTFLKHTLTKAGITSASPLSVFAFTAEVFNEHTLAVT
jgi:AMMECR1 domain-containing protein